MTRRTSTAILLCAAMFAAAPAFATEDAAISTAARVAPPGSAAAAPAATPSAPPQAIGDQISNYLATSPAATLDDDDTPGVISGEGLHRQIHGEVSVSVGSHGYRDVYARSDIPVGKTGQLSIAVQDSRGRGLYGPGYGYGSGYYGAGGYGPGGYGPGYYGFGYGHGGYGSGQSLGVGLAFGAGATSRERCLDRWNDGGLSGRSGYECRRVLREPG